MPTPPPGSGRSSSSSSTASSAATSTTAMESSSDASSPSLSSLRHKVILAPGSELAFRQMVRREGGLTTQPSYSPLLRSEHVCRAYRESYPQLQPQPQQQQPAPLRVWDCHTGDPPVQDAPTPDTKATTTTAHKKSHKSNRNDDDDTQPLPLPDDGLLLWTDVMRDTEPLVVPLCGHSPAVLAEAVRIVTALTPCLHGIDLHLDSEGGEGASLLQPPASSNDQPPLAVQCLRAMKEALDEAWRRRQAPTPPTTHHTHNDDDDDIPPTPILSCTIRLPQDRLDETVAWARRLVHDGGCELLAVHCPSTSDFLADLQLGKALVRALPHVPVVLGLDLHNAVKIQEALDTTGAHAVMLATRLWANPRLLMPPPPHQDNPACLAASYLEYVAQYPPPASLYIRRHLRWIFRSALAPRKTMAPSGVNLDKIHWRPRFRKFLTKPYLQTLEQFRGVVALYAKLSRTALPDSLRDVPEPSYASIRRAARPQKAPLLLLAPSPERTAHQEKSTQETTKAPPPPARAIHHHKKKRGSPEAASPERTASEEDDDTTSHNQRAKRRRNGPRTSSDEETADKTVTAAVAVAVAVAAPAPDGPRRPNHTDHPGGPPREDVNPAAKHSWVAHSYAKTNHPLAVAAALPMEMSFSADIYGGLDLSDVPAVLPLVPAQRGNQYPYSGVSYCPMFGWETSIRIDGRMRYLGAFSTMEDAALVYARALYKVQRGFWDLHQSEIPAPATLPYHHHHHPSINSNKSSHRQPPAEPEVVDLSEETSDQEQQPKQQQQSRPKTSPSLKEIVVGTRVLDGSTSRRRSTRQRPHAAVAATNSTTTEHRVPYDTSLRESQKDKARAERAVADDISEHELQEDTARTGRAVADDTSEHESQEDTARTERAVAKGTSQSDSKKESQTVAEKWYAFMVKKHGRDFGKERAAKDYDSGKPRRRLEIVPPGESLADYDYDSGKPRRRLEIVPPGESLADYVRRRTSVPRRKA